MIGMLIDYSGDEITVSHSSNAEKTCFWLNIKDREGKEQTAQLSIVDAMVLMALLEKAIDEAEE